MQANKYLEDLGIPRDKISTNICETTPNQDHIKCWKSERKKYGFDSRSCWNLDMTFAEWLYSHLCMFLAKSKHIDLTYHTYMWDGNKINQLEAINLIKDAAKEYIIWENEDKKKCSKTDVIKKFCRAVELWAKILPSMWT